MIAAFRTARCLCYATLLPCAKHENAPADLVEPVQPPKPMVTSHALRRRVLAALETAFHVKAKTVKATTAVKKSKRSKELFRTLPPPL